MRSIVLQAPLTLSGYESEGTTDEDVDAAARLGRVLIRVKGSLVESPQLLLSAVKEAWNGSADRFESLYVCWASGRQPTFGPLPFLSLRSGIESYDLLWRSDTIEGTLFRFDLSPQASFFILPTGSAELSEILAMAQGDTRKRTRLRRLRWTPSLIYQLLRAGGSFIHVDPTTEDDVVGIAFALSTDITKLERVAMSVLGTYGKS